MVRAVLFLQGEGDNQWFEKISGLERGCLLFDAPVVLLEREGEIFMPCKCLGPVDITVYRHPSTIEGQKVKIFFDSKGVCYEDLDVSADLEALERMKALSGQTEHTVIVIDDRVFTGFDPEELVHFVPSFF